MALFVWWPNPLHLPAGGDGDRRAPARPRHPDARCGARAAVRQPPAERVGRHVAVRGAGVHQLAALSALSPAASSPHAAGRGSRPRPVGAVPDHAQEPVAQDRAATSRGRTAYQRRLRAVPPRPRQGCAKAFIANLVLLGGLAAAGYWWLYPVLWLLPLATWYQLVSRIRNIAEHAVVPDNDDPAAQHAHDPRQFARPAAGGALLGELPPRAPPVHVRAVLAAAGGASRAAGGGHARADGDPAGLCRGAAAGDVTPGTRGAAAHGPRGLQHI